MSLEPAQLNSSGSCCSRHSACLAAKAGKRWFFSDSSPSHWRFSLEAKTRQENSLHTGTTALLKGVSCNPAETTQHCVQYERQQENQGATGDYSINVFNIYATVRPLGLKGNTLFLQIQKI